MQYPVLKELPVSPAGKICWPWTKGPLRFPEVMSCGSPWPKISIITPSYNQGDFIEETIRSVLLQGYPNLEYIIIDGGSTDNSLDIIKKYERFLAYWVSEPDRGQTHAINKGVEISTGNIIGWINSDDVYCKGAFKTILDNMLINSDIFYPVVFGGIELIDEKSRFLRTFPGKPVNREKLIAFWRQDWHIPQPTVFFRSDILKSNKLNESLHYAMDWELYLRVSEKYTFRHIPEILARFRAHGDSKTSGGWGPFTREQIVFSKKYWCERYIYYSLDYHLWPVTKRVKKLLGILRRIFRGVLGQNRYEKAKYLKRQVFTFCIKGLEGIFNL
ncbi:MAG: glycosyltransferase family 2 protein [bacterium]